MGKQISVRNVINGEALAPKGGEKIEKYSPRDGRLLYRFAGGSADEVDQAVAAGRDAFNDDRWSRLPIAKRAVFWFVLQSLSKPTGGQRVHPDGDAALKNGYYIEPAIFDKVSPTTKNRAGRNLRPGMGGGNALPSKKRYFKLKPNNLI